MKVETDLVDVNSNIEFARKSKMKMDPNKLGKIMLLLTSMYHDPYVAVPREYIANAFDSHRAAGVTKPIEVSLPSELNPYFTVKDFGLGLSAQELDDFFFTYGASVKDESNDDIGGWGLGCKSALMIADSFTVVSVKDGIKNTVIVSKDNKGVGEPGFFKAVPTDEPNGLTVNIPVADPRKMREVFKDQHSFLTGYPKDSVLINGQPYPYSVYNKEQYYPLDDFGWIDLSFPKNYYNAKLSILLGPVFYHIDLPRVIYYAASDLKLQPNVLTLKMGLDELHVTPSRDDIVLDEFSIKNIKKRLEEIASSKTYYEAGQKIIDQQPNLKKALNMAQELVNVFPESRTIPFVYDGYKLKKKGYFSFKYDAIYTSQRKLVCNELAKGQVIDPKSYILVHSMPKDVSDIDKYLHFLNPVRSVTDKIGFLFVHDTVKELHPFILFDQQHIYSWNQFVALGQKVIEERKHARALTRKQRPKNTVNREMKVTILTANSFNVEADATPANTINTHLVFYVDKTVDDSINKTLSIKTTSNINYSGRSVIKFITSQLQGVVIRCSQMMSAKKVKALFPQAVNVSDLVKVLAQSDPYFKQYYKYSEKAKLQYSALETSWFAALSRNSLNLIENKDLREMIASYFDFQTVREDTLSHTTSEMLQDMYRNLGDDVLSEALGDRDITLKPLPRLPLLETHRNLLQVSEEDIVEYVNMKIK